jgi:hypothetical protein
MQDIGIRPVDMRHTLPNLKNLLLTLSSPAQHPTMHRSASAYSAASSRQTSNTWSFLQTTRTGTPAPLSPVSSAMAMDHSSPSSSRTKVNTPSPLNSHVERRSRIARQRRYAEEVALNSESESEGEGESVGNDKETSAVAVGRKVRV